MQIYCDEICDRILLLGSHEYLLKSGLRFPLKALRLSWPSSLM